MHEAWVAETNIQLTCKKKKRKKKKTTINKKDNKQTKTCMCSNHSLNK